MENNLVYLKPSVQFEPLFNQWYAWGHLISPATAAMVSTNLHLRVLDSFVRQPQLHKQAVANQAMRGGMYMDYSGEMQNVVELLETTRKNLPQFSEFAFAIKTLNEILAAKTDGMSLATLYKDVPPILKGLVELVYDLQHRPGFRLIEPLLYDSPLYQENLQSLRFSLAGEQERAFVLSSPRFAEEGVLNLRLPFAAPLVDTIFKARTHATDWELLKQQAGWEELDAQQRELFSALFTAEAPPRMAEVMPVEGVRVRYFGHATVLVQTPELSILIDPAISYFSADSLSYTLADLPEHIDYVLMTHNHQDHVMLETLLQLRHKIGTVVVPRCASGALQDPSLKLMLRAIGFAHVYEMDEMEQIQLGCGAIHGLPFFGEHADLDIRSKLGYCLQLHGRSLVFLADSNALEPMLYQRMSKTLGHIDAMFIGLECDGAPLSWLYGPLLSKTLTRSIDQSRRLNSSDCASAMQIVQNLNPDAVYVYAMGLEPWLCYISSIAYTEESKPIIESNELLRRCQAENKPAERLYLKKQLQFSALL